MNLRDARHIKAGDVLVEKSSGRKVKVTKTDLDTTMPTGVIVYVSGFYMRDSGTAVLFPECAWSHRLLRV